MRHVGSLVFLGVPTTSIMSGRQEASLELKAGKWIIPLSFDEQYLLSVMRFRNTQVTMSILKFMKGLTEE